MTSEMALCIPGRLVFGYKLRILRLSSLFAEKQRGHVGAWWLLVKVVTFNYFIQRTLLLLGLRLSLGAELSNKLLTRRYLSEICFGDGVSYRDGYGYGSGP